MQKFVALKSQGPDVVLHWHWFDYAYKHSMASSPLRKMLADHCVFEVGWWDEVEMDMLPKELLFDSMRVQNNSTYMIRGPQEEGVDVTAEKEDDENEVRGNWTYECTRKWRTYYVSEDF